MDIFYIEETDSTNDEVKRFYKKGYEPPFWIYADHQTSGRGRKGRHWDAGKGNLTATGLYKIDQPLSMAPQLGFIACLAVADCLDSYIEPHYIHLKWPNDIYIKGYKCAGILLESWSEPNLHPEIMIAIGIGLNLISHPKLPEVETTDLGTHLKSLHRTPPDCLTVLRVLSKRFEYWYSLWIEQGFSIIRKHWCKRALGFGQKVVIDMGNKRVVGVMHGLDEIGGLRLKQDDHHFTTVYSGESCFSVQTLRKLRESYKYAFGY